ncbi:MAG: tetratricopeptide repeat protein, partial [Deltaproteobacteria bacterium]|nr:tetratricopeptide repeat protein [Deltaproteobacteria bacterium]
MTRRLSGKIRLRGKESRPTVADLFLLLFIVPLALYFRAVFFDFINYDDVQMLVTSTRAHGLSPENLRTIFSYFFVEAYYPVRLFSFALDYEIYGGPSPAGFHLTNLALHLANVWLVFLLARQAARSLEHDPLSARRLAMAAAALFAVHPAGAQVVGWIPGREEVLMVFFFLSGLLLHRAALHAKNASLLLHVLAAYAALFAGLCHVTAVVLPLAAVLLLVLVENEKSWRAICLRTSYLWAVAVLVGGLRYLSVAMWDERTQSLLFPHLPTAIRNLPRMLGTAYTQLPQDSFFLLAVHYLGKWALLAGDAVFPFFVPDTEGPFYGGFLPRFLFAAIVLCGLALVLKRLAGEKKLLVLGAVWFFGIMGFSAAWTVGLAVPLRFFYLPWIGFCLAGGVLVVRAGRSRPAMAWGTLFLVLLAYGGLTTCRLSLYDDPLSFHQAIANRHPWYWKANESLAKQYYLQGRYAEAHQAYTKALEQNPGREDAWVNLVNLHRDHGDRQKALELARRGLKQNPNSAVLHLTLASVLDKMGKKDQAFAQVEKAVSLE